MTLNDTRGTSITIEYTLTLLVALSVLSGVTVAVADINDDRKAQLAEDQLEIAGNEIAVQLEHQHSAYRRMENAEETATSVASGSYSFDFDARHNVDTPEQVVTGGYTASLSSDAIILTANGGHDVEVPIRGAIPVREGSGAPGGDVAIVYDSSVDQFALTNRSVN